MDRDEIIEALKRKLASEKQATKPVVTEPQSTPPVPAPSTMTRVQVYLFVGFLVAGYIVSIAGFVGMAYYVLNGEWLPAIFILLARKQLVGWLHGVSDRSEPKS